MTFDDRLLLLIIGVLFGYFVGVSQERFRQAMRKIDDIKEELDEVDEIVKEYHPDWRSRLRGRGQDGVLTTRVGLNIVVAFLVIVTAIGAVQAGIAVNRVNATQDRQNSLITCTAQIQRQTIKALNVRTKFTRHQVKANIDLQRAQSEMISVLLHEPPYSDQRQIEAFKAYFDALNHFVNAASKSQDKSADNPYPNVEQFNACIAEQNRED